MSQNMKVTIKAGTLLPVIAAGLSLLAAVFTVLNRVLGHAYMRGFLLYTFFDYLLPMLSMLIFTIFAVTMARKYLQLMLIPAFLVCLCVLLTESGILYAFSDMRSYFFSYLTYDRAILMFGTCFFEIIKFIIFALTIMGKVKIKAPFVIVVILSNLMNAMVDIYYISRSGYGLIPWYSLSSLFFSLAMLLLVLSLATEQAHLNQTKPQQTNYIPKEQLSLAQDGPIPENLIIDKIKQLSELNKQGILTEEEFERKKKELLDRI